MAIISCSQYAKLNLTQALNLIKSLNLQSIKVKTCQIERWLGFALGLGLRFIFPKLRTRNYYLRYHTAFSSSDSVSIKKASELCSIPRPACLCRLQASMIIVSKFNVFIEQKMRLFAIDAAFRGIFKECIKNIDIGDLYC